MCNVFAVYSLSRIVRFFQNFSILFRRRYGQGTFECQTYPHSILCIYRVFGRVYRAVTYRLGERRKIPRMPFEFASSTDDRGHSYTVGLPVHHRWICCRTGRKLSTLSNGRRVYCFYDREHVNTNIFFLVFVRWPCVLILSQIRFVSIRFYVNIRIYLI